MKDWFGANYLSVFLEIGRSIMLPVVVLHYDKAAKQ